MDLSKFESNLDNLVNFSLASEVDIRTRVTNLPKIQQQKMSLKLDHYYQMINAYQNYDLSKNPKGNSDQEILSGLYSLIAGPNKNQRIDFEELV